MENYFKKAEDLEKEYNESLKNESEEKIYNEFFKKADDLETNVLVDEIIEDNKYSYSDVNVFLSNVISGIKYDYESEMGTICSEGSTIVSLKQLIDMVDSGEYNIISANYFNDEMIDVRYQQFDKSNIRKFR